MKKQNEMKDYKQLVLEQVYAIRKSGLTNMLDYKSVRKIANEFGYNELASYIDDNKKGYSRLIFTGSID